MDYGAKIINPEKIINLDLELGNNFLDMTIKAQEAKKKQITLTVSKL